MSFYALTITDWLPPSLTVVGVCILGAILWMAWRDRRLSEPCGSAEGAAGSIGQAVQVDSIDPLRDASNDLFENVQNVASHLEQRTRRLTLLLGQAQKRIELLEDLVTQSDRCEDLMEVAAAAPIAAAAIVDAESASSSSSVTEVKQADDADPTDPLRRAIYDLADDGATPLQIARNLNEQIGKVELILALRGL